MNVWPIAGAAAAATASLAAWGACHPGSQLFGRTLRRIPSGRGLALTFDDGPNPAVTPRLLDLLDRQRVPATFFLIGRHVRACPALAAEIAARRPEPSGRGHALGNHTHTHPNLVWCSPRSIGDELRRCQEALEEALASHAAGASQGVCLTRWMRPPYGYRGPQLDGAVRHAGYQGVAMWSVSGRDWRPQPTARLRERLRPVRGGDIVLLHDGAPRALGADREHTLGALEYWLPRWKDAGLEFVTLDDLPGNS